MTTTEAATSDVIDVLGFSTTTLSYDGLVEEVERWIEHRDQSRHLLALNPIKVCRSRQEPELAELLQTADLIYPDAYGIAWAMGVLTGDRYRPIPGCDLMQSIMQQAARKQNRIYLIGSKPDVIEQLEGVIRERFGRLVIVGQRHGYFSDESERRIVAEEIITAEPDIVFVGMGAWLQENFIALLKQSANEHAVVIPLLMGVGGSFDALTGHVRRPPDWMLRMHLEWLYRLLQQPFRAPRMIALPKFALLVLRDRFLTSADPRLV